VVYPRIKKDLSLPIETQETQNKTLITYKKNSFTNDIDADASYRLRLHAETMTYELKGVSKNSPLYSVKDFENILTVAIEADYHQVDKNPAPGTSQIRLIEHIRTIYRSNNLKDALPLYQLASLALPFESYQLAYTPTLVDNIFGARVNEDLMLEGKFTHREGDDSWWIRSGIIQFVDIGEAIADARDRFYLPISYTDPYGAKTKVKYDNNYQLFIEETEDALGNKTKVELYNFRTLSPQRTIDPNNNISEAIIDELGLVKAMAVFGKGNEADDLIGLNEYSSLYENTLINDFFHAPVSNLLVTDGKSLLQHATARFVYDFDAYKLSGKPVAVASIVREEHYQKNNDSPVQISIEYSNGLGHVVMKKVQAEPGPAKQVMVNNDDSYIVADIDTATLNPKQLRWIGNGRTVLNNKGNAVKQYEPYFSVTHNYEDLKELVETGVTPIMYYDAPGRLIKTEMPDGTLSRSAFDSWKQVVYDQNDTILESSWYHKRSNRLIDAELIAAGKDPEREKSAAEKAAIHAGTPNVQHFDTLGRPVLSVDHNKHLKVDEDEFGLTRVNIDIEGNLRKVTDARGNVVMQYKYDMLGNKVYQRSMDAGQSWILMNILGNPLRTWDERDHEFQYFYDILHRPSHNKVIGGDGDNPLNHIFERIFYGETEGNSELKNFRGQVIKHYDTGGLVETPEYDFKGQPKSTTRKMFKNYKGLANWADANLVADLESESFTFVTETDAIGRITKQTAPDGSIIMPSYNEAGLLNSESVTHADPAITTTYIKDIDYNEKGQRNTIIYGNDVITQFYYDKESFRLRRLETKRKNNDPLQDWRYTYDPVGNITHIEDRNIPVVFFDNQIVTGVSTYTYDALYRLAEATGRENNTPLSFNSKDNWNDIAFMRQLNHGDPIAMRNYTQNYLYDEVGNILQMRHQAVGNNWTRDYNYQAANNRLISTQIGTNTYSYPHHSRHGFITAMPHLEEMGWNFKEELVRTVRQRRTDGGTPETTYYQYDGQGQRIRKITENQADTGDIPGKKDERIYIAGYELYKQHSGSDAGLERTSLSLMDNQHRFAMIDTETKPKVILGIPMGRTSPVQTIRYQLHNHLGSAALELDDIARVISYEEFHPYGTTAYQAKHKSIQSAAKRYRYTGMERDEESGLEYHSARYYLPWLGRWLSCDPIGIGDGVNDYKYVSNNPIKLLDESGTQGDPVDSGEVYDSQDVIFNPNDVVYHIGEIQKPNDVAKWWADVPKSNRNDWAHPLSEMEQGYIQAMTDTSVPAVMRMRVPVNPHNVTTEERNEAEKLFGRSSADYERYSNFENRRRIIAHYVYTHPATIALEMGIYRLFRDVNPLHFALERGWQMGSGREMFTQAPVSRLGAAAEFFAALALSYGISRGLRALRYSPTGSSSVVGSIGDDANFAQKTYKNAFTNEPGAGFRGMNVDQVADALRRGVMHPRMVPVDYIIRDGRTLILNTRSAQALTEAGIPRSQWAGANRTGNPAFESRLTGQLRRNNLTSSGTPTVRRSGTPRTQ
jgi:RHS repeat-associated protein